MGDGYWSQTNCTTYNGYPDARLDVWWWWEPGTDRCWYWTARHGEFLVWGAFLRYYGDQGYQCSWLGAPVSNRFYTPTGERQNFEGGYMFVQYQ